MPRVALTESQRLDKKEQRLSAWCFSQLKSAKVTQKELARYIGATPSAVCHNLTNGHISTRMLIGIVTLCKVDEDDLKEVLTND